MVKISKMTSLNTYLGVICVLAVVCVDIAMCGIKKNFRKSNKIAHFMGKRTENEINGIPYINFPSEIEARMPLYQNEIGGFPEGFPDFRQMENVDGSLRGYPVDRQMRGYVHVGGGRALPYDEPVLGRLSNQYTSKGYGGDDSNTQADLHERRSLLARVLEALPEEKARILANLGAELKDSYEMDRS